MALLSVSEGSEEEFHSLSGREHDEAEREEEGQWIDAPPTHPLPSMQGAFEESILESTEMEDEDKSPAAADPEGRRHKLLSEPQYDDSWTTRWKQKPSARHHPLIKLMAQIVFGMHLLQQQQAKSDEEVVKILQTHVDEVDSFLEKTSEDFDLAIRDIEERIHYLKLPMKHMEVFDVMLNDKNFRMGLIDGNDKIEAIISRTAKAMNAALLDVAKGIQATEELKLYLNNTRNDWPDDKRDLKATFSAMQGNEEGWIRCLRGLQNRGNNLSVALVQLGTVIGEISKLAATASLRGARAFAASNGGSPRSLRSEPSSPGLRSKFNAENRSLKTRHAPSPELNKPLPRDPDAVGSAFRASIPKMHPIPFEQRFEKPRQGPPTPQSAKSSILQGSSPRTPNGTAFSIAGSEKSLQRPTPSGEQRLKLIGSLVARDARTGMKSDTAELADFLRESGPLSMNPPSRPSSRPSSLPPNRGPDRSLNKRPGSSGAEKMLSRPGSSGADKALRQRPRSSAVSKLLGRRGSSSANTLLDGNGGLQVIAGADRSASVSTSASSNARQDSAPGHATGFSRRLSKRLKHLPPSEAARKSTLAAAGIMEKPATAGIPPNDSAYNSGTDMELSPTMESEAAELQASPKAPSHLTPRSRSALGFFPAPEPLTPSAASTQSSYRSPAASPALQPLPRLEGTSGKSRSLSIRNMFHRKSKIPPAFL